MPYEHVSEQVHQHGVQCTHCSAGWYKMTEDARASIGSPCSFCKQGVYEEYKKDVTYTSKVLVCRCGSRDATERTSLGIYAGVWCDPCWKTSGYRKEGPEGFDPLDAGESYDEDDY